MLPVTTFLPLPLPLSFPLYNAPLTAFLPAPILLSHTPDPLFPSPFLVTPYSTAAFLPFAFLPFDLLSVTFLYLSTFLPRSSFRTFSIGSSFSVF